LILPAGKTSRALAVFVALLALGELTMQIRAHLRFGEARATYTVTHPVLGKTPKPNFRRSGTLGTLTINKHGFRGEDFSGKPAPGVVRVVCLGSSVVFGGGGNIGDEDTFPYQLEELLNAALPTKAFEVINAASPGWGAGKLLWRLENDVMPFEPQFVVIYGAANDIGVALKGGASQQPAEASLDFLNGWPKRFSVAYNAFRDFTAPFRPDAAGARFKTFPADGYSHFFNTYKAIVEFCKREGLGVVLATEAQAFRREQPVEKQYELLGGTSWGLGLEGSYVAHGLLNQALRDLSVEQGVPLVDLATLIPGGREYFVDSIHLTSKGNRKAATLLAEQLRALASADAVKTGGADAF
jgi:lysophospholipase L1-like esterase